jgi:uncharacterized protein DUF5999
MCQHRPACPDAQAPDSSAAHVVASHPEQGWSLLCNGVVLFDDAGKLLPDGRPVIPLPRMLHTTGRLRRGTQPISQERVRAMTTIGQAQENREYVRKLLRDKQPGFAAALESAERQLDQELSRQAAGSAPKSSAARHKAGVRRLIEP